MITPLVSIIIPVYNAEKYVAETITSAINQTWPNTEIIVVNDGSTDDSLTVAQQFSSNNVKVYSQHNQGASVARNYGLQHAQGKYVQFLDADDLLSVNKIEEQIKLLANNPGYVGLCGTIHFQDGTDPLSYPLQHEWVSRGSDNPVDFLIKLYGGGFIGPEYGGMIQPNAWLTPRALIDKAGPWNEMRNPDDDGEFFCRVVLSSKGIVYATDAVNYYRKFNTGHTLSARNDPESAANILRSTDLKAAHLLAKTNQPKARLALSHLYYENAFSFYPQHPAIATEAEQKGRETDPGFVFRPYYRGIKSILSGLFGWRFVKRAQYIKQQLTRN